MEDSSKKKASITRNKYKDNIDKARGGFHEGDLLTRTRRSPRSSYDYEAYPKSFHGSSVFWDSDSYLGSKTMERKAYPLPHPLASRSIQRVSISSCSSYESSSSSSSSDDDDDKAEIFHAFRVSSKASYIHPSPWDASLDSPTEKHPCHPLPRPPSSPSNPSSNSSKWKKGKLLGRGTFGHVYAGFNSENGTMCAMKEVKLITDDDQSSKEWLKQLNQEIALLSELSHPNIVQYYGSELGSERLSVYLEYVSGGSIQKLLGEYGSFDESLIRTYTRQILNGLAYLHGRNTVHRDIKGANLLVDPNGEIKLVDFGMAKHMTSCASMLSFKGSPYWMAPEVIMNAHGYSLAVDIWSLGCTILEMATSKPPWSQYEGRDPTARPTALQLLQHPFIHEHVLVEAAKLINLVDEASPSLNGRHSNSMV
ncbi:hypothetical protein COLO4_33810 [Corchorus olitorius]|uniref:mitogen-activated protein kinase kinase kinase n=1 Tax=Corchorus olitorius TaxID=93759 RepID=A0A1R3GR71_9ROSI|nr:hypothetical protein COLO4_33810 [Corchorus olitorius]